ncbi:MAG: rRNA maturation RNase YbeY [Gammaproteobacteria bacterium]
MSDLIEVQRASGHAHEPSDGQVYQWVTAALHAVDRQSSTLTVRLVDEAEMASLNQQFRGRSGPTNVLSFAFESPPGVPELADVLGDVVICMPLVEKEAAEQQKTIPDHLGHLTVHGVLHLSGFDHETSAQAEAMEALEIQILASVGIQDPYRTSESIS